MDMAPPFLRSRPAVALLAALLAVAPAAAEVCYTAPEMEPAARAAIERTAQDVFQRTVAGDTAGLRQMSIASLASDFGGIQAAVEEYAERLSGARAGNTRSFLLENNKQQAAARADFFCGVFGPSGHTASSVGFSIPNLAPGRYAVVMQDVTASAGPHSFSVVLEEDGGAWKLAGLYVKPTRISDKDGNAFWERARQYKAAGKLHNAWFYYLTAHELLAPVPFMSTGTLDKLYDEMDQARPSDLPAGRPVNLSADGRTFQVTQVFPVPVNDGLSLVLKYSAPDISNTAKVHEDNKALIKAYVDRYPEYREAFVSVVARAVEPSGRDFGSLMAMKDVK
jgi:hypothetical protein